MIYHLPGGSIDQQAIPYFYQITLVLVKLTHSTDSPTSICVGRLILWTASSVLMSPADSEQSSTKVYEAKFVESEMSRGLGKESIYLHLSQKYAHFGLLWCCSVFMLFYFKSGTF